MGELFTRLLNRIGAVERKVEGLGDRVKGSALNVAKPDDL